MSNLNAFFSQNAVKPENIKVVVSERFRGEDGKAIEWEIGAVTESEFERISNRCKKRVPVPENTGQYEERPDKDLFLSRLAVKCTVYPELGDAALQNSYGVMSAEALLTTMLLPGEYIAFMKKIDEINGFKSMQKLVEEVKN